MLLIKDSTRPNSFFKVSIDLNSNHPTESTIQIFKVGPSKEKL